MARTQPTATRWRYEVEEVQVAWIDEAEAGRLAGIAVERHGGGRMIVGSPRHPYSPRGSVVEDIEGHTVTIHYGEISAPAIAIVGGWVFEIRERELVLLDRPRRRQEE